MPTTAVTKLPILNHGGKEWVPKQEASNISTRVAHILNSLPTGIIILNSDGIITESNPAAEALLGVPLENQLWLNVIKRCFAPQKDDGHEVSLKNGCRIKLDLLSLFPEAGQLILLTDLTQTRLLQQNISHLQRLSALGEMVAKLAHQVRTPLSSALLYAANLGNENLIAADKAKFQARLMDGLNELERCVSNMLLMAKGEHQLLDKQVTADNIFQHVMASCEILQREHKLRIEIVNNSTSSIAANIPTLSSAVVNLITNSLEAKANQVSLLAEDIDSKLCIRITDNGSGMDTSIISSVLQPFFTTKAQGTGLGLAVLQSVVLAHLGKIKIHSELDKGCCISLFFPVNQ